jgi:asparagine synthase (glutamine-hydrolysing)
MYAFAIWDRQERRGILARDPFGIKPLFVAQKEKGLVFASEIKALLSSGLIRARLSPEGTSAYLRWGSVDQDLGILEGIQSVQPGFYLEIHEDKISSNDFQSIPWDSATHQAGVQDFRQAFLDSVSAHLVSDVPVGLFLSGGLDSSSILAACHILGHSHMRPFTLSFPDKKEDESPTTRRVADYFGIQLISENPQNHELPSFFSEFLDNQDLPSIDGFNTYYVSRLAARHGAKVVLSGLGGDELLGGYPSFQRITQWCGAGRLFSQLPGRSLLAGGIRCFPGNKTARLSEFLAGPPTPFNAYTTNRCLFTKKERQTILSGMGIQVNETDHLSFSDIGPDILLSDISRMEASYYMKNQLLRDSDAYSMRHGIELRVPFVDVPLWTLSSQLPASIRYDKGKALLKKAFPELPEWLFTLPKKGFALPYDDWRKGPLLELFKDFPRNALVYSPTWYQEMALLSLNRWQKSLSILS